MGAGDVRSGLPRAVRLLIRLLPAADREYVAGDLEEEHALRLGERGRLRAALWAWKQAGASLAAVVLHRLEAPLWVGDARRAFLSLWRSPGFTVLSVATLALGTGALTAMFTVLDQVVLEPLPVEDQDRVVVAWNHHQTRDFPHFPFTLESLRAVREGVPSLAGVAATPGYGAFDVILTMSDGREETIAVALVVDDFFGVLGVSPAAGRTLRPEDDREGAARVAVISWNRWTSQWGRSPEAVGSTFATSQGSYTVVGVLPRGFDYPAGADVWVPFRTTSEAAVAELDIVGRVAEGARRERVAEEIAAVYRNRPAELRMYEGAVPVVRSLEEVVLGDLQASLLLLFGGAALVLVAAAVNVASLVQVRAIGRVGAVALRRALGAARARLVREALAEALWLGLAGGIAGAATAALALRLLLPLAPDGLPRIALVGPPDLTAVAVAAGVTGLVVVVLTMVPVVRAFRVDPAGALRSGGRTTRGGAGASKGRRAVVGLQTAMAVWTAAVGLLLVRSLVELQALDPGFDVDGLVLVELAVPYRNFEIPEDLPDRMDRIETRIEGHPSVTGSAWLLSPPHVGAGAWAFVPRLEGQTPDEALETNPYVNVEMVGADYFETLALPLVDGRALGGQDHAAAPPAVVVNEAAARLLWPGREAMGQRLAAGFPETANRWWTVVGVATSSRYQDFLETRPVVYFPTRQLGMFPLHYLAVRAVGEWGFVLPLVRRAVAEVDPAIRVKRASPLRTRLEEPLARPRFAAVILAVLAGATLLLAAVGVYGAMAFSVRSRTLEMGLRLACGATPAAVRRLVLRQGMLVAAAGVLVGALAVVPGATFLQSLLFRVAPSDPWSLAGAATTVLAVALVACWLPAARAARLDPARIIRSE
jgi:predicted permease